MLPLHNEVGKGVGWKQVAASTIQDLKETLVNEDIHCGCQAMDTNLNSIMNMLVDMSSQLQATEETMEQRRAERATPHIMSSSITHANQGRAKTCHQQSPHVPDLSEDVRQKMARRLKQLPIIVYTSTNEGASS